MNERDMDQVLGFFIFTVLPVAILAYLPMMSNCLNLSQESAFKMWGILTAMFAILGVLIATGEARRMMKSVGFD